MSALPDPVLTSTANPRVKAIARLRDRRERERTGLTLVDGARELRRALDTGVELEETVVCEPLLAGPDARAVLDRLASSGTRVTRTNEAVFARLAFGERTEGLVGVIRTPSIDLAELRLPPDPLVVVVEGVEKPGNLGAILRSADGAGADAVVAASPRTDLFNPNTIRASAGTAFTVSLAAAPSETVLAWLRARAIRIVTTRVDAVARYDRVDLTGPVAIVLGSEAEGLADAWSGPEFTAVRIPMRGVADSLNVSVTAAVLLFEARRQRDAGEGRVERERRT